MLRCFGRILVVVLVASALPYSSGAAQEGSARAFTVFLDCSGFYCDQEFFRTDVVSVDWVRERSAADVHVLITRQPTGGGGRLHTLAFIGQRQFGGIGDTLTYVSPQASTSDETRRGLSHTMQLGLVRYLARTSAAGRMTLTYAAAGAGDSAKAAPLRDPWNAWVFSLRSYGNGFREENYSSLYLNGRLGADRVTERWKSSISVNENYGESRFSFEDDQSLYIQRGYDANLLHVRSLSEHWSAGITGAFSSSTYLNQRIAARLSPAVEYDLFPYAEATRRQLRLQYGVGVSVFSYYDTTQFDKVQETLPVQVASVAFSQREIWGSMNAGIRTISYVSDLSRRKYTYSAGANVRVLKGLSVNFSANYASIHDQFYLPKESITRDAALLRQTQQGTRFSQFFFVGLNYSFGSVLNNVVNPRFGEGNEGFFSD